jgi:small-conductance mechanosensitive channel
MQFLFFRCDLFLLTWFGTGMSRQKIKSYVTAGLLCIFVSLSMINGTAYAQSESSEMQEVEVPQALGPDAMKELVSKLNEKQTAALIELINLLNAPTEDAALPAVENQGSIEIVKLWFADFGASLKTHLTSFPQMAASVGKAIALIFQGREVGGNLAFLLLVTLSIAIGVAAEWLFKRSTRDKRERIRQSRPEALMDTLKVLSARAGIEIGGVLVFTIVAIISASLFITSEIDYFLVSTFILTAILITRLTGSVMHFVLAPRRPELRLVFTDSWNAQYIERNFILIAVFVGIGLFIFSVMQKYGISHIETLRFWAGLAMHSWIVLVIFKTHHGLTQIIEGGEENLTPGLKRMANWWPILSAGLVGFNWLFLQFVLSAGNQALTPGRSAAAITLIVIAPFLDTIVRGIAAHLVPSEDGKTEVVAKAFHETRRSYIRIGRIVLLGLLIIAVGKLWGVNLRNLAEAGFGAQVAANGIGFLLILALGYLAWEVTNLMINKRLAQEAPGEEGGAEGGTGQTRIATILPILRMTLQATIITITVLLALSQLGANIAPLLAGAGVLGLAIGFGAQTLVKDIVSGVFFLLDDAFRLGEFITVGTTNGVVSKISVRSLQLRQDTGQLHIVPYGSMSQLTNNSRDWVTLKLRFTVPFDTDQEQVRKLFKKIGQEMMEVPALAEVLINPFKSQGAADVTDVGIVIRGKFSTVPGGQFIIRKEVYSRVQKAFEANGIEFARKEVRVSMPGQMKPEELSDAQKGAISAAASDEPEAPKK